MNENSQVSDSEHPGTGHPGTGHQVPGRQVSAQQVPAKQVRKMDRRVSRTRRLLRDALFSLILDKGYEAVTVEEITERADLGRTTFYLHYHDKDDLFMQSIGELVDDLVEQMSALPRHISDDELAPEASQPAPVIALAFEHVANNADLYRIILRGEGTYSVTRRLREIITQASGELIQHFAGRGKQNLDLQVPLPVFLSYLAGSWLGIISWWLENDLPYSASEIALMFQKVFVQGARSILAP